MKKIHIFENALRYLLDEDKNGVLNPQTEAELAEKGIITLSMVRRWISEGDNILQRLKDTEQLSNELVKINLYDKFVLYNSRFNKLMPSDNVILRQLTNFKEGYAIIQRNDYKVAFINTEGQQICDWYDHIWPFENGLARVRDGYKWTVINTQGQQICDWYANIYPFNEGFARVQQNNGSFSFINTEGQQICDWYRDVEQFHDGLAKVRREDGKWSFINTNGEQIGDWYQNVADFADGVAKVKRGYGMISLINRDGKQICDWYKFISDFDNGIAYVQRKDGKYTFINTQGQQISDWYKDVIPLNSEIAEVQREDGMVSLINTDGKQICDWLSPKTRFCIMSPNEIYDNNGNLIPLYNESYLRLNNPIAEALHASIRDYLLYN